MSVYKGNDLVLPDAQGGAYFDSLDAKLQVKISNQDFNEFSQTHFSYDHLRDITSFIFYNNKNSDRAKSFNFNQMILNTDRIEQIVFAKNELEGDIDCREMCFQSGTDSLKSIDFNENYFNNINFDNFAQDCNALKTVNFKGTIANKVLGFHMMFHRCEALESVDMSGNNIVDSMTGQFIKVYLNAERDCSLIDMFSGCQNLQFADLSGIRGEELDCNRMFIGCAALQYVDLSGVQSIDGASTMFQGCRNLWSIDLRGLTSFSNYSLETFEGVPNGCRVYVGDQAMKETIERAGLMANVELDVIIVEPNNEPVPWSLGDDD